MFTDFADQYLSTKVSSAKHKTLKNTYSTMASNCGFENMKTMKMEDPWNTKPTKIKALIVHC